MLWSIDWVQIAMLDNDDNVLMSHSYKQKNMDLFI